VLLRAADLALYHVKASGRGAALLFRPALRAAADARAEVREALPEALAGGAAGWRCTSGRSAT
jgi:predicted signal transduction protein with EAL and GGDEF domain